MLNAGIVGNVKVLSLFVCLFWFFKFIKNSIWSSETHCRFVLLSVNGPVECLFLLHLPLPRGKHPPPLVLTTWCYFALVTHQRAVGTLSAEDSAVENIDLSAEPEQI